MMIRAAGAADAVGISRLLVSLTQQFIAPDCTPGGAAVLLESMSPPAIRHYIEQGYRYFVAESEGEIVGAVGVRDGRHLYHLFVAESHQGQGLARLLWGRAVSDARDGGNPGAFTVNSSPNALAVYEQFGFRADSNPVVRDGVTFVPMTLEFPATES